MVTGNGLTRLPGVDATGPAWQGSGDISDMFARALSLGLPSGAEAPSGASAEAKRHVTQPSSKPDFICTPEPSTKGASV